MDVNMDGLALAIDSYFFLFQDYSDLIGTIAPLLDDVRQCTLQMRRRSVCTDTLLCPRADLGRWAWKLYQG